jgi:hypothetical protein
MVVGKVVAHSWAHTLHGPIYSYIAGDGSRSWSVGNWEAFIGVGFGWGVGFSTLYLSPLWATTYN